MGCGATSSFSSSINGFSGCFTGCCSDGASEVALPWEVAGFKAVRSISSDVLNPSVTAEEGGDEALLGLVSEKRPAGSVLMLWKASAPGPGRKQYALE